MSIFSWKVIIGLILILLASLLAVTFWLRVPRNRSVTGGGFAGIIFHERNAPEALGQMLTNDRTAGSYWMPTREDIINAESQLLVRIKEELPALTPRLQTFHRQYFGFIRDGRKQIFVVGFCEPGGIDWRAELVTMPDEEDCYFEAQFDVDTQSLLYVWEHSEIR